MDGTEHTVELLAWTDPYPVMSSSTVRAHSARPGRRLMPSVVLSPGNQTPSNQTGNQAERVSAHRPTTQPFYRQRHAKCAREQPHSPGVVRSIWYRLGTTSVVAIVHAVHHWPVARGWSLRCEDVEWVERDWPGWIRVRLVDADGRAWFLVDKIPVFGLDLGRDTAMPLPVDLLCDVVAKDDDQVVVVAPRWHIEAEDGLGSSVSD